jgi:hypothetical protein
MARSANDVRCEYEAMIRYSRVRAVRGAGGDAKVGAQP